MLTSETCRMVRGWLGWDQNTLANKSGVGRNTISLFENKRGDARKATLYALQRAFAEGGVYVDGRSIRIKEETLVQLLGFDGQIEVVN